MDQVVKKISQPSNPSQTPGTSLPCVLTLAEFSDFVENRRGIVLDARYRIDHQLAHVPGALSLPRDEFADGYAALKSKLQANRSQPIAIYCDGKDCVDSKLVQKAELALMEDLHPLLIKRAGGRDISGLSAYEQ